MIKTESAKDLSWWWLVMFLVGVTLWFVYGALRESFPLVLTNTLSIMLACIMIMIKVILDGKP